MTEPAGEQSWADFREQMFGPAYDVWHDGPDFAQINRRYLADPALVTRQLLAGIAEGDALPATTVRELRLTEEQRAEWVGLLRAALSASVGSARVEIGASLHALTGEADATPLLEVLASKDLHWGIKMDAARRLLAFPVTPELVAALSAAVEDPDYLVRYHSANTLLGWAHANPPDLADHEDLFPQVAAEDRPDLWAAAAARLRGMFDAAAAERDAESTADSTVEPAVGAGDDPAVEPAAGEAPE